MIENFNGNKAVWNLVSNHVSFSSRITGFFYIQCLLQPYNVTYKKKFFLSHNDNFPKSVPVSTFSHVQMHYFCDKLFSFSIVLLLIELGFPKYLQSCSLKNPPNKHLTESLVRQGREKLKLCMALVAD